MNVPRWRSELERYVIIALCVAGAIALVLHFLAERYGFP